jgi:long-subunit acyl-CoA synthetase (AMP-forming)
VATNKNPKVCVNNASAIQKFEILPCDFSVQGDELTATLKLKRSVAEQKWLEYIEKMY